jgi:hypothetical protein
MLTLPLVFLLAAAPKERTVAEVQRLIETVGPRNTWLELDRNDGGWVSVLTGIGSGKPEWLAIASTLYPVSDGGGAEDLAVAVQDALLRNPSGVLDAVEGKRLPVETACGGYGSGLTDAPRAVILAAIDKRIGRIRGLRGATHDLTRRSCLDELRKLRELMVRIAQ